LQRIDRTTRPLAGSRSTMLDGQGSPYAAAAGRG
jgi:hypothetical protein